MDVFVSGAQGNMLESEVYKLVTSDTKYQILPLSYKKLVLKREIQLTEVSSLSLL